LSLLPITPLIIGGEPYSRGQWPWLIAVHTQVGAQVYFRCGATLISKTAAITAAHCFFSNNLGRRLNVDEIYLAIGRYNIEKFIEPKTQILSPSKVIAHESYDFQKLKNGDTPKDADIGIMILERAIEFNEFVKPVCLDRSPHPSTAQTGVVAGWGLNENRTVSKTPSQVTVTLVSELDCLKEDSVYWHLTSNRTFCAGDKRGRGPCTGDSGGGLVVEHNGRWMLRGVVSAAVLDHTKSCDVHKYAIYTDVNKYINWIDMHLEANVIE
jgi:secreted trypsin-like serine protease